METRIQKMEKDYHSTAQIYDKQRISRNTRLRQNKTITIPETLYSTECINSFIKKELED